MLAQTREQKVCCLRICLFQPFVFRHCGLRPAIYCDRFATRCIRCLAVWIAGDFIYVASADFIYVASARHRKQVFLCSRSSATSGIIKTSFASALAPLQLPSPQWRSLLRERMICPCNGNCQHVYNSLNYCRKWRKKCNFATEITPRNLFDKWGCKRS